MRSPRNPVLPRKDCPVCGIDVAVSKEGRMRRHVVIMIPYQTRVWCPAGGHKVDDVRRELAQH